MSSSKERQNAIKKLKAMNFSSKIDIKVFREKIDETFSELFIPNRVDLEEKKYGEVVCDILKPEIYSKNRLMIYVHAGSFIAGSRKSYRSFVATLTNSFSCVAIIPEFRLAPAHPFPFSLNDIQEVFRNIYNEKITKTDEKSQNIPEIIIAADTSGASIALGFLLNLKAKFRSLVNRVILFSPWLNISEENQKLTSKKSFDEVFTSEGIKLCAENYTTAEKRNEYLVSPLLAKKEQLEHFPPVYIQMGEKEMFLDDVKEFEQKLLEANIPCTLDIWHNMMPLFQLADEYLEESHLAIEKLGKIVTNRIFEIN